MYKISGMVVTGILVLSLTGGTYAFSEGSCAGSGGMHAKMFEKMSKGLDLTDVQQEQLKHHFNQTKESGKAIREEMKSARELLREELSKPEPSSNEIDAIVVKMKDTSSKAIEHRVNSMVQMREILTEEQYKKFAEKTQKHWSKEKRRQSHKKRHKDTE